MKLLIKSNKNKYKVAQRVFSFKKKTRLAVMNMHSKLFNNHSLHSLFLLECGVGGIEPPTKFSKKGGHLTGPQLSEGVGWERRGWLYSGKRSQFLHKSKSTSEIFNDRKSLWAKISFSVITKKSEISTKNLITFKR